MPPLQLLSKIRSYYAKSHTDKPPAITTSTAALLSAGFVVLYVLPFYLSKTTRPSPSLSRDAPSVIRARIRAVTSACVIGSLLVILIVAKYGHANPKETLHLLGWWPVIPMDILRTLLLCSTLFAGPLFEGAIAEGKWREWIRGARLVQTLSSWTGWRNIVAGPVTEEIVFRSLLIPLHLLAHVPPKDIVFITPLYFGIAHIHHLYEFRLTRPEVPVLPAVLRTVFQFTYTSLFGFFAAFLYLRTGSVWTAIAAHSFCNWQGVPRLWGRVHVEQAASGHLNTGKRSASDGYGAVKASPSGLSTVYTLVYYLLLVAGAYGFYVNLFPLTASPNALASFTVPKGK